jgi:hypothetical protein
MLGVDIVGVAEKVGVGVKVGDQHRTSAETQFDARLAMFAAPIKAWLDIVAQPETGPHHVKEPDVIETLPMFHFTGLVEAQPLHPPYVTPAGTVSYTKVLSGVVLTL